MSVAVFTTATPTSTQLETEWRANWRGNVALRRDHEWLHVSVKLDSYPGTVNVYLKDRYGDWGLSPDGAFSVATPTPSTGVARLRYFTGPNVCGVVVGCATAGTSTVASGRG